MRVNGKLWSACAVVAILTVSPVVSNTLRAAENAASAINISKIRIGNFGRVDETYYRGEQPVGRDYKDLSALGIKTVIDLQADGDNRDEARLVADAGMTFYRIPMTTRVAPTAQQLAQFMAIVNDPAHQPVYVHCAGGRHRTGVMTAVYRMERNGWSPARAFQEMKQYKFGMDFLHPEFKRFVYSYEPGQVMLAGVGSGAGSAAATK